MFWLVPPSFYTTHKSITAATAHNPIATGGTHRRCSFVLCGELTNTLCRGQSNEFT